MTNDTAIPDTQHPLNREALVAALGVVFGDIGTSPLYALRESFGGDGAPVLDRPDLLGVLSLILWALMLVISIKYLVFVLRADNQGEGGIIALVALLNPWRSKPGEVRYWLMLLGLFGACLLYGDGTITPAISVLSAVEGLHVAAPGLAAFRTAGHDCDSGRPVWRATPWQRQDRSFVRTGNAVVVCGAGVAGAARDHHGTISAHRVQSLACRTVFCQ